MTLQELINKVLNLSEVKKSDELGKRLEWKYFWWVKKDKHYGLATFATSAEKLAERPSAGTSLDVPKPRTSGGPVPLYQKPVNIQWLVTNKEAKKAGQTNFFDYINSSKLPTHMLLDRAAIEIIMDHVDEFARRNIGDKSIDDYTQEEMKKYTDIEEQTIASMKSLPISLDSKLLSSSELAKVKESMIGGRNITGKYGAANIAKNVNDDDVPRFRSMAKRALD